MFCLILDILLSLCAILLNHGKVPKQSTKCASMDDHELLNLEVEWEPCYNYLKELLSAGSAAHGVSGIEILPDERERERERERDEDNTASTVFAM
jgi:hypothetical protein